MILVVMIVLLVVGSLAFHFLSPWYLTPLASNWDMIDLTLDITFWVCGIVFVAINLFMAYCVWKYRYREDARAEYEPENKKLEVWLTAITAIGVTVMLAPGLVVWADFVTPPDDADEIEVASQQWHWTFRLPGEDGEFGAVESRYVSVDNPFGMERDDPKGQDDVLIYSPTIHIPKDRPVRMWLRAKDVLHNFAVAQFRVKMDMVPGLVSYLWFTPTKAGNYEILCEELCGVGHHTMRGMVIVDEQEDYDEWLAQQPTYADILAKAPGDAVAGQAAYAVCASCHGQQGEGNQQLNAPKLAGQEDWYLRRQLEYFKTGVRGTGPGDTFGVAMGPMANTLVDDAAVENVIAYIQTLPDEPPTKTVVGDIENGEDIYNTCAVCHGQQGEGYAFMNAPRQAGLDDWYLVTQLKNFRSGARGAHSGDAYGMQMNMMAAILNTDQAIDDVVAYINTLDGPVEQTNDLAVVE
ncbi:MAG: c-type cytochrome [Candidatus Azotimanducaceae bacterium]